MYEFDTHMPCVSPELAVQVYDYDRMTADDLMGETTIDLEQRYYSKHRATVGLPKHYDRWVNVSLFQLNIDISSRTGYNAWHDQKRPTQILRDLCMGRGLAQPKYRPGALSIGTVDFEPMPKKSAFIQRPRCSYSL